MCHGDVFTYESRGRSTNDATESPGQWTYDCSGELPRDDPSKGETGV
jgi:hypothetical protein